MFLNVSVSEFCYRYLSQVFVKDLQTHKTWTFIYNDWLAADRGSILQTSATVTAIGKEELSEKHAHNFTVKSTRDLRDGHLWISIFSKPARSTFTRVQRLTCGLSLLLSTMLTNIMFYGVPTNDPEDQVGGTGGVSFSLSAIVIGIESSLLMFPVNLFIVQLFLKLKPKPIREPVYGEIFTEEGDGEGEHKVETQGLQSIKDQMGIPMGTKLSDLFSFGRRKSQQASTEKGYLFYHYKMYQSY